MSTKVLTDADGDSVTISTKAITARSGEVTLTVRETFGGTHQAAVHVNPQELIAAIREIAGLSDPDEELAKAEEARSNAEWSLNTDRQGGA